MNIEIVEKPTCTVIKVRNVDVQDLEELSNILSRLPMSRGYCIDVDKPWVAGFIAHELHPSRFVAIYDEERRGFIVIERHVKDVKIGEVLHPDQQNMQVQI